MTLTVFVPSTPEQAVRLRDGSDLGELTAYAVGAALREAHGLGSSDDEEAGFVALGYAGLAGLLAHPGPRLVLAAEVDAGQVDGLDGSDVGEVTLTGLRWAQVRSVFADEAAAADDLGRARAMTDGRDLDDVADDEAVLALVDAWDLLWYDPSELDAVG